MNYSAWARICLINLFIVSLLGLLMRYKIGFDFPYLEQKNIQHAHSHFAFSGWISLLIMVFMSKKTITTLPQTTKHFKTIFIAQLICAYGMLISFLTQSYGTYSIIFSTGSILISFYFSWYFIKLTHFQKKLSENRWQVAALFFNIVSCIGTFYLSYMMATKNFNQDMYLASVYWYLHFQYNGWFFFGCAGIFISYVSQQGGFKNVFNTYVFWMFFLSCIPAYGLSILWSKPPQWFYIIIVLAAFAQLIAWLICIYHLRALKLNVNKVVKAMLYCSSIALTLKLTLQLVSTIPYISHLAFGFRPIVIAYLHLVLLAFTSIFLLAFVFMTNTLKQNNRVNYALLVFTAGVFINELILAVQGIASLSYTLIPFVNEMLFGAAAIMVIGLLALNTFVSKQKHPLH